MGLQLVPVNVDKDRSIVVDLLNRNLPQLSHEARYRWLYQNNPDGCGFSWFLIDGRKDQVVGIASVFPRIFSCPEGVFRVGQVGDFAINDDYRSLGPAIQLQKATLTPLQDGQLDFCYDTPPGAKGMAPFVRMGLKPFGQMVRYAKPLRLDAKMNAIAGDNLLGRLLSRMGNRIFWAVDRPKTLGSYDVELYRERFGDEFLALTEKMRTNGKIFCLRTPMFLNWRYRDDPCHTYTVFTLRDNSGLRGYCIYLVEGGAAHLMDLFGDDKVLPELFCEVINHLRTMPLSSLQANFLQGSHFIPMFEALGFRHRSPGCFLVGEASSHVPRSLLLDSNNWIVTYADSAL